MNLYVVRNKEGKYFRPVGQHGRGGSQWQDSLEKAKFYPKESQARSRITFFARNSPKFGVCDLLEFTLDPNQAKVIDVQEYVDSSIKKIEAKKQKQREAWAKFHADQRQKEKLSRFRNY